MNGALWQSPHQSPRRFGGNTSQRLVTTGLGILDDSLGSMSARNRPRILSNEAAAALAPTSNRDHKFVPSKQPLDSMRNRDFS